MFTASKFNKFNDWYQKLIELLEKIQFLSRKYYFCTKRTFLVFWPKFYCLKKEDISETYIQQ